MNEAQALQILDSIASRTQMNREAHDAARQAMQVLARALQELAELRRGRAEVPKEVNILERAAAEAIRGQAL